MAGTAKGRRLVVPKGKLTRPTPERVREAIFNSLHSMGVLTGARVLDIYAGTGALGIEALSRGAESAVFIENHQQALNCLKANLDSTRTADKAQVIAADTEAALDVLRHDNQTFDVALVDPPYAFDGWSDLLAGVPAPVVVVESDRCLDVGTEWEIRRRKRYGSTVVTLIVRL